MAAEKKKRSVLAVRGANVPPSGGNIDLSLFRNWVLGL